MSSGDNPHCVAPSDPLYVLYFTSQGSWRPHGNLFGVLPSYPLLSMRTFGTLQKLEELWGWSPITELFFLEILPVIWWNSIQDGDQKPLEHEAVLPSKMNFQLIILASSQ